MESSRRRTLRRSSVATVILVGCGALAAPVQAGEEPSVTAAAAAIDAASLPDSALQARDAQRDVFDVIDEYILRRRIEPEVETQGPSGIVWSAFPTVSYNPVYGIAVGASASGAGRLGGSKDAKPSVVSVSGNYASSGQVLLQARADVYSPHSTYLARADVRYLDTERSTWGLGPITPDQQEYPMEFRLTRLYATLYRRVVDPVYVGLGFHHDEHNNILDQRAAQGESTPFTEYSGGNPTQTRATGLSLNILADTRDNPVNPVAGYFLAATFYDYLEPLGSDRNWQEYWVELRLYPHLPMRSPNVLAFWLYSWFSFGPGPFLALPAVGWDTQGRGGRGYLQGRIRGENQVYFETEYRCRLRRDGLLGAVAFLSTTITTLPGERTFGKADKAGGIGLRLKFNKHSDTNLAIDRGWGEDGQGGWFLGLTEVF